MAFNSPKVKSDAPNVHLSSIHDFVVIRLFMALNNVPLRNYSL